MPNSLKSLLLAHISRYWQLAYAEGKEGRTHDTEAGDAQKTWHEIKAAIESLSRQGATRASEAGDCPDPALLASMATCLNHGFGLDNVTAQARQLANMRKLWDEVMGRGYYKPEHRERYASMLASAPAPGGE